MNGNKDYFDGCEKVMIALREANPGVSDEELMKAHNDKNEDEPLTEAYMKERLKQASTESLEALMTKKIFIVAMNAKQAHTFARQSGIEVFKYFLNKTQLYNLKGSQVTVIHLMGAYRNPVVDLNWIGYYCTKHSMMYIAGNEYIAKRELPRH